MSSKETIESKDNAAEEKVSILKRIVKFVWLCLNINVDFIFPYYYLAMSSLLLVWLLQAYKRNEFGTFQSWLTLFFTGCFLAEACKGLVRPVVRIKVEQPIIRVEKDGDEC